MLAVYVYYPGPTVSAHAGVTSVDLQKHDKANQRYIHINMVTLSEELLRFRDKYYKFAANTGSNDMWIDLDFDDPPFEKAVLAYILQLLGSYYVPFEKVPITFYP